jgi:hypothetical protein
VNYSTDNENETQTDQKKELFRTVQRKELWDRRQNEERVHKQIQETTTAKVFPVIVILSEQKPVPIGIHVL